MQKATADGEEAHERGEHRRTERLSRKKEVTGEEGRDSESGVTERPEGCVRVLLGEA